MPQVHLKVRAQSILFLLSLLSGMLNSARLGSKRSVSQRPVVFHSRRLRGPSGNNKASISVARDTEGGRVVTHIRRRLPSTARTGESPFLSGAIYMNKSADGITVGRPSVLLAPFIPLGGGGAREREREREKKYAHEGEVAKREDVIFIFVLGRQFTRPLVGCKR